MRGYLTGDGALRILQIVGVLAQAEQPLSRREIARRIGVTETAVRKRVPLLGQIAPVEEDDRGRLYVRREALADWLRRAGWPVVVREYDPAPHPVTRPPKARRVA